MNHKLTLFAWITMMMIMGSCNSEPNLGIFTGHTDIGKVGKAGSVEFNRADSSYTITGSGTNMWFNRDELHYLWTQATGDISIEADIRWPGEGVDPHRKACLMIRQSLDSSDIYVDVALHGDGLTSLQFRNSEAGNTNEVQSNITAPGRVKIEKTGEYISLFVASPGEEFSYSGASCRMSFEEPFYIGLGVCAHNNEVLETAVFSNVRIETPAPVPDSLKKVYSTLEVISMETFDRRIVYQSEGRFEAPNWTPDGQSLIYNSGGLLYRIPVEGGEPQLIPTDFAERINNDHGISPDGSRLVISDGTETGRSMIYTLPIEGGVPEKVTPLAPSYWHGWSPDGSTLAYCAERNGNYDIYTIPVGGGKETRLTTAEGLDDGPDYSPDGKYIYFNSVRTGTMQIWRMNPDGTEQQQITTDQFNDWFAHPSPDGNWIVYVTFGTDVPAGSHPPNKDVMLRLMRLSTRDVTVMARLFGGQGTINVPSWSPDGQYLAFVSYQLK